MTKWPQYLISNFVVGTIKFSTVEVVAHTVDEARLSASFWSEEQYHVFFTFYVV